MGLLNRALARSNALFFVNHFIDKTDFDFEKQHFLIKRFLQDSINTTHSFGWIERVQPHQGENIFFVKSVNYWTHLCHVTSRHCLHYPLNINVKYPGDALISTFPTFKAVMNS
jgi:hypothetical protein